MCSGIFKKVIMAISGNIDNSLKVIAWTEEEKQKAIEILALLKQRESKLNKITLRQDDCIITYYTKKE